MSDDWGLYCCIEVGRCQSMKAWRKVVITFERLVDVTSEVIDPCGVIELHFSSLGHTVLCDVNGRVVVFLLYPVQNFSEAERCHFQPERARIWPSAIRDRSNSPRSSKQCVNLIMKIPLHKNIAGFRIEKAFDF